MLEPPWVKRYRGRARTAWAETFLPSLPKRAEEMVRHDERAAPWRTGRGKERAVMQRRLGNLVHAASVQLTESLRRYGVQGAGADGRVDWGRWVKAQRSLARTALLNAVYLAAGTDSLKALDTTPGLWSEIDRLDKVLNLKLNDLARRARLVDGEEKISDKQARAWAAQAVRGSLWAASQIAGLTGVSGPVVRVLGLTEHHCRTCPPKAGEYPSLAVAIAVCGGLPGDGSDDCHGNCYCRIMPRQAWARGPEAREMAEDTTPPEELRRPTPPVVLRYPRVQRFGPRGARDGGSQ